MIYFISFMSLVVTHSFRFSWGYSGKKIDIIVEVNLQTVFFKCKKYCEIYIHDMLQYLCGINIYTYHICQNHIWYKLIYCPVLDNTGSISSFFLWMPLSTFLSLCEAWGTAQSAVPVPLWGGLECVCVRDNRACWQKISLGHAIPPRSPNPLPR